MSTSLANENVASASILLVDDDEVLCEVVEAALCELGYAVETTTSPLWAVELVRRTSYAAVLTDLAMDEMSGLTLCENIRAADPGVPIIILTGAASVDSAISALRLGVRDYLEKPFDPQQLHRCLRRALELASPSRERERERSLSSPTPTPSRILGTSQAMQRLGHLIDRCAAADASLLILGETGTGKELAARTVHARSARRGGPFVAVNCAAIPTALLESELFGHVRGAFTDAKSSRKGLLLEAHGGTLFLDEIGELPLDVQTKLLRVIQERRVRPVGDVREAEFDVRLIVATHRDLEAAVNAGTFRKDLYYRINIVTLRMPPLREHASDILLLAQHFLARQAEHRGGRSLGLSLVAAARLVSYPWPGNVRELENCTLRAAVLATGDAIQLADLPEHVQTFESTEVTAERDEQLVPFEQIERCYVLQVLESCAGNMSLTARKLGVDRRTLRRKVASYRGRTSKTVASGAPAQRVERELCELCAVPPPDLP